MHYLQLASFRWPHEHNRECIDETAYQGTISVSVKHILSTPHRSSWTRRESSESESIQGKDTSKTGRYNLATETSYHYCHRLHADSKHLSIADKDPGSAALYQME